MTDLRTAAQQALEAWEYINKYGFVLADYEGPMEQAITALKAALEQHEKDVEWMKQRHANWRLQKELAEQTQERDRQQREYEESRSAALEQPEQEQEPVAWMYVGLTVTNNMHGPHLVWKPEQMDAMSAEKGVVASPLYTHPPRREWRSLSEEEIESLWRKWVGTQRPNYSFTRAVEAALRSKNHE
jgi:hypothetical protein